MKEKLMILGTVVAVVLLLFLVFPQHTRNKAIALEETVETAKSDIKVQEKRRVDLIFNLADCVKQYDKHESETLTEMANNMNPGSDAGDVIASLKAVSYSYPELQSQKNYQNLMTELALTENMISQSRQNYNLAVNHYKQYVRKFPHSTFISMTGYEVQDYERLDYKAPEDAPKNIFGNG